jgi:C-terminal processing protease CtpA/Prc
MNTDRLAQVCKLWGRIKYLHPYLAYRDIDWDAALVNALPKIMASSDTASYAKAVGGMLEALQDPATRIEHKNTWGEAEADAPIATSNMSEDGVLLVWINLKIFWTQWDRILERLKEIAKQVSDARAVIVDLRFEGEKPARSFEDEFLYSGLAQSLCSEDVFLPAQRSRMHNGFVTQHFGSSGGYSSSFVTVDGKRLAASDTPTTRPVIFLVNQNSSLPSVALALQDAGVAAIIAEEEICNDPGASVERFKLEDDFVAEFRVAEFVYTDGTNELRANLTISETTENDLALEEAFRLARAFTPQAVTGPKLSMQGQRMIDHPYPEMTYPNLEYRLLALFRVWNVFELFFPYKDLMDRNWEDVLREFIPRFIEAEDARAYTLTLAEMLTHLQDSHVSLNNSTMNELIGVAHPMVRLRHIQGEYVFTDLLDESTTTSGLELGDVLVMIDDEPIETRVKFLSKILVASTLQSAHAKLAERLLKGLDKSSVKLIVKNATGELKDVTLGRTSQAQEHIWDLPARNGPIFTLLSDHIGYADLDRLKVNQVDEMFEMFKDTRAIIFDMRGYPHATAWTIAPRLSERTRIPAAKFQRPRVTIGNDDDFMQSSFDTFVQYLPTRTKPVYPGKTVMLIDERAVSQAEHTGLFFKVANDTCWIGSATTGANGDITSVNVPGNGHVIFTGQAVMHVDGKQLQRIGLIPDLEVHPTIQGIREGRDEILETAIKYLNGVLEQ